MLAYHTEEEDAEENAASRAADGERIETLCLWAAEAYSPANIANLLDGLKRLDLTGRGVGEEDPAAWVRNQRHNSGSRLYLYFLPPGSKLFGIGYQWPLPKFAKSAQGSVWMATPSLTMFAVMFDFTDEAKFEIDRALHRDYRTRLTQTKNLGVSMSSPELERRRACEQIRMSWANEASDWFETFGLGIMADDREGVPTCELDRVTGIDMIGNAEGRRRWALLSTLALGERWSSYRGTIANRLQVTFDPYPSSTDEPSRHSIMVVSDLQHTIEEGSDIKAREREDAYEVDEVFRSLFAQWSMVHVLNRFWLMVARGRDSLSVVMTRRLALAAIARARRDIANCVDAGQVARSVEQALAAETLRIGGTGFTREPHRENQPVGEMKADLASTIADRAATLAVDVAELNANLQGQANLLAAHANLKLQPWIIFIAALSALAAIIASIGPARDFVTPKATSSVGRPAGR